MKTKKQLIELTKELTFAHNRNSVYVTLWDCNSNKIQIVTTQNSYDFLKYFSYGQCMTDDQEAIQDFLEDIL